MNNTQSSIADLLLLHQRETQLLTLCQSDQRVLNVILQEFSADGYDLDSVMNSDIYHPVDSYNLIKRTARTWRRILSRIDDDQVMDSVVNTINKFPDWRTSRVGVALGLLNIHKYYDLQPRDLAQGVLHDLRRNLTWVARTRLGAGDAKLLAEVALEVGNILQSSGDILNRKSVFLSFLVLNQNSFC